LARFARFKFRGFKRGFACAGAPVQWRITDHAVLRQKLVVDVNVVVPKFDFVAR
jgi:hypothetical protein